MARLLRMGAVGGAMAVPIKAKPAEAAPPPAAEPEAAAEAAPARPPPREAPAAAAPAREAPAAAAPARAAQSAEARRLEEHLEAFERSFEAQLELLVQPRAGTDVDSVIMAITSLNVQLRTKQSSLETAQRALDEARAKTAQNPVAREADAVRREIEEQKKRAAVLGAKAREQAVQIADLERRIGDKRQLAQTKAKAMVKELMNSVFDETLGGFEDDGRYRGDEIKDELSRSLRKNAEGVLTRLREEGLI
jgi:hypothetical protein